MLTDEIGRTDLTRFEYMIVCTSVESLEPLAEALLDRGAGALLVEKPGCLTSTAALRMADQARARGATVRIALNRRYFASVRALALLLQNEQPVAAQFDFAERMASPDPSPNASRWSAEVLCTWAIANSIHVMDTVFHLLGPLEQLDARIQDADALDWHPTGATFMGHGVCGKTPVSYSTSWLAPGHWSIEVLTRKARYRLSPMENLGELRRGETDWREHPIDRSREDSYKAGLFDLVSDFEELLRGKSDALLPDYAEHARTLERIARMVGYDG